LADEPTVARVILSMVTLNDKASTLMLEDGVHAATDITGFGFLGHTIQLANNSHVGINIDVASVPLFPGVAEFAAKGLCPGGLYRNHDFYAPSARFAPDIPTEVQDVLHDPQTSGGLLMCIAPKQADRLLGKLKDAGIAEAAIIGEVVAGPAGIITLR
ncbi:MAG: AIR synthase-related protein, partial [Dehalococcoidales bacterium]|nr:AIR synthase-related protein [Dehalococcoidales bacterium]